MPATPSAESFWTPEELEQMVQWLEEPSNQSRFKKGSGLTKKAALAPLARQLSSKTAKQIFDKYCNIKISEVEGKEFKNVCTYIHQKLELLRVLCKYVLSILIQLLIFVITDSGLGGLGCFASFCDRQSESSSRDCKKL
jgi:hypothetical protein